MKSLTHFMIFGVCFFSLQIARAETIHAAVAANFTAAMKDIAAEFEAKSGHKVILSFGSSGKIFAQISHGAPFHIFLSADQAKPAALTKAGLSVPQSQFTYAIGSLVLWSAQPDFLVDGEARLKSGAFNKLALANPKLAPYGAAALEVLTALQLKEATEAKWVQGENISQTYQFVASGNAELGFIALSQVMDKGHIKTGSSWIVPSTLYRPVRQDAVLLKSAEKNTAAIELLAYLRGNDAHQIIHNYGYRTE